MMSQIYWFQYLQAQSIPITSSSIRPKPHPPFFVGQMRSLTELMKVWMSLFGSHLMELRDVFGDPIPI